MTKWNRLRYCPCIPLGEDGRCATSCKEHIDFSRKAASEGMVLLKNDNQTLPLKKGTSIAIFGKAQIDYVRIGGGSGEAHPEYERNIYEGFKVKEKEEKIEIFHPLSVFYEENIETRRPAEVPAWYGGEAVPGCSKDVEIPDSLINQAREFADVAVITICRYSGEELDRTAQKGDFYLSETEEKMIAAVCEKFDKVIAILNIVGVMDTEWFKNNDKISSALLAWNAGMEGGLAVADIICGDVNPSGKLTDTFAKSFEDYPSAEHLDDSEMFVKYYEDIYVGYRYFETIKGAAERVNYPFGFGLSYTSFEINDISVTTDSGKIIAKASVKNTGDIAGKEVIQLYYSAPQGKLGKPALELAAFKKTELLLPGDTQTVELTFEINDMASYDDLGKCVKSAYILEQGDYTFHIGNSVRNTVKADYIYTILDEYVVTEQLTEKLSPFNLEKRLVSDGSYETIPSGVRKKIPFKNKELLNSNSKKDRIRLIDVANGKTTLDEFVAQLSPRYMAELLGGKENRGVANNNGIGGKPGNDEYGVPCAMTTDGPSGIRIQPDRGVCTTSFPCATLMACSWEPELMYEFGKRGAIEAKENNLMIWLTPGMNIHRNPLCGRNFEYFSEDPLIAGKMAAAKVRGIQSQNIAATPKHFAVNHKETNRKNSDSIVSERALREIYLKGFEICVKESSPRCIMTSYNLINGERASENHDLITKILRDEWGFDGLVMTDWKTFGNHGSELLAGTDVRMPTGSPDDVMHVAIDCNQMSVLQESTKRVLNLLLNFD